MLRFHSLLIILVLSASRLCFRFGFPLWNYLELSRSQQIRRRASISGWSDPKTVSSKSQAIDLPSTDRSKNGMDSFRFAAFGTSRTWGAWLDEPDTQAYIKLLSPSGANFGIRATDADYPSLCLHTMLENEPEFDVIILEFFPLSLDDFERLVKRIRSRFPSAIIIFLALFMPLLQTHYRGNSVFNHLYELGIDYNKVPVVKVLQHMNAAEFSFPLKQLHEERVANCSKIVHNVGGHVLEFPVIHSNIKSFILDSAKYFGNADNPLDFVHPSAAGHQAIANHIREVVSEVLRRSNTGEDGGSVSAGLLTDETKFSNDRCTTYYTNGDLSSLDQVMRDIKGLKLVNMMETVGGDKWALEVERTGAEFNVVCGFPNCGIHVTYMIKGPEKEYPRVLFLINDGLEPILVEPPTPPHHVSTTSFLASVAEAGLVRVRVTPLPEDASSPLLFRITSIITYQHA